MARAQQQKSTIQALMPQSAPVVDLDEREPQTSAAAAVAKAVAKESPLANLRARLAALAAALWGPASGHKEAECADRRRGSEGGQREGSASVESAATAPSEPKADAPPARRAAIPPPSYSNPVLQSQLRTADDEIAKHLAEQRRLNKQITGLSGETGGDPDSRARGHRLSAGLRNFEVSLQPTSRQRAFRRDGDAVGDPPEGGEVLHTRSGATGREAFEAQPRHDQRGRELLRPGSWVVTRPCHRSSWSVHYLSPTDYGSVRSSGSGSDSRDSHLYRSTNPKEETDVGCGLVRAGYRTGVVCDSYLSLSGVAVSGG